MLHPSYTELMEKINKEGETGEKSQLSTAVIPSLLQLLREQERLLEEMNL